jgi:hypothetical protein
MFGNAASDDAAQRYIHCCKSKSASLAPRLFGLDPPARAASAGRLDDAQQKTPRIMSAAFRL